MAYDVYDSFAFFYNKYWTAAIPALMEKALEPLLFSGLGNGAEILDLCCGTGGNAAMMNKKGYKVVGVDGSAAMLAYASLNVPTVEFARMDAVDFDLGRRFDAVTCLFDSVNHILEENRVVKTFRCVYGHLKENGIFVFDVNSERACAEACERAFSAADEGDAFISSARYDKKSRLIYYNLTMFTLENRAWRRGDLTIMEKYYTERELISMLRESGFSNVRVSEGREDLNIESFDGRIFFTAWK